MNRITLEVSGESHLRFIIELLLQFEYIKIQETPIIAELIEDLAVARAIEEGKNSGISKREDIFKILKGKNLNNNSYDCTIQEKV